MDNIPLISSPLSEAWPSWLMLCLLLCLVVASVQQPDTIRMSFRTTFSRMERIYGDSAVNIWGAIALVVFRLGVIAMTLYLACYEQGHFSILTYFLIILIVLAFVALKSVIVWLLSYVFELKGNTNFYMPQYSNIWTAFCIVLYPFLLIMINIGNTAVMRWMLLAVAILFCIDVIVKLVQHYYSGLNSLPYIALYALTLEIIPMTAMVIGVQRLI